MWIRSQGKANLVNASKVKRIRIYYFVGKTSVEIHADDTTLGRYSTEEKALKVLDMIQKRICDLQLADRLSHMIKTIPINLVGMENKDTVFQMPQDSEV